MKRAIVLLAVTSFLGSLAAACGGRRGGGGGGDGGDRGGTGCASYETVCNDGIDQDCDGDVDCNDVDCAETPACGPVCTPTASWESSCADGRDNDCNGWVDCADSYCGMDPACRSCSSYETSCVNGLDDDCDGWTDCSDSTCTTDPSCRSCSSYETSCVNGIDDDCDGWTDCSDSTCSTDPSCRVCSSYETSCTNGLDDDCDSWTDCSDADCYWDVACGTVSCADYTLFGAPVSYSGSTVGAGNDLTGATCGGGGASAPDVSFEWTAPYSGTFVIDTLGSAFDTVLYVRDVTCTGTQLGCSDDYSGATSQLSLYFTAGQTVVIVVDGYSTSSGAFSLHIN